MLMSPAAVCGRKLYLEIARARSDGKMDFSEPKAVEVLVLTLTFSHLQKEAWGLFIEGPEKFSHPESQKKNVNVNVNVYVIGHSQSGLFRTSINK